MAATVTGKISISCEATHTIASENQQGTVEESLDILLTLLNGSTVGKINKAASDRRTLGTGANEDLDLAGGFTDPEGTTITFTKVKFLAFRNRNDTDGQDLEVGPASSNGWVGFWADASDRTLVQADGWVLWYDPNGITVTAGTGDLVNVDNGTGVDIDYDVMIWGD